MLAKDLAIHVISALCIILSIYYSGVEVEAVLLKDLCIATLLIILLSTSIVFLGVTRTFIVITTISLLAFILWNVYIADSDTLFSILVCLISLISGYFLIVSPVFRLALMIAVITCLVVGGMYYGYKEYTLTPEEQVVRAMEKLREEKTHIAALRQKNIREAQAQIRLAEVEAERLVLYSRSAKTQKYTQRLEKAKAKLNKLRSNEPDRVTQSTTVTPLKPFSDQTEFILTVLGFVITFFLERILEKIFKDKGYALLAVGLICASVAYLTAAYFLFSGSATGGLIGSLGQRGEATG